MGCRTLVGKQSLRRTTLNSKLVGNEVVTPPCKNLLVPETTAATCSMVMLWHYIPQGWGLQVLHASRLFLTNISVNIKTGYKHSKLKLLWVTPLGSLHL